MFYLVNFQYFVFFVYGCDINKGGSIEKMSTPQLLVFTQVLIKVVKTKEKESYIRIYEKEKGIHI